MKKSNDELLINGELRDELIGRVEVLNRVKAFSIPTEGFITTQQVADFYEVNTDAIDSVFQRNEDELVRDGLVSIEYDNEINTSKVHHEFLRISIRKTYVIHLDGNELTIDNHGLRLFTRKSILRVGMLLQDSEIADKVRTLLNEEQNLMLAIGMAVANGDIVALAEANTNMMRFKNRHIVELSTTI